MKFYFLVEGRRTEKKLYRAWLGYCFPHLQEVAQAADLTTHSFFILAGMGYPSYLQRIPDALADSARYAADHLFICIDAEERTYDERKQELHTLVDNALRKHQAEGRPYTGQIHIIVADCCIETWLLGHQKLMPRQPNDEALAKFKRFYDVSRDDPERMDRHPGHPRGRADFHLEYLSHVFRHHGKSYSKERPGIATEASYFAALRDRCLSPTPGHRHLASFHVLWSTWAELGGRFDMEAPPLS
ncbi:hypothetical protein [Archangium primigenium]|uniref:hypothetical protein n=1 Tax=[Archangium] primigenium TaxID=2792470 RepID=UPI0019579B5D|nr:hypothetical protein [Archangium primigenium]MBM7118303.1 hypothetical protein [Archangium primigenium]